MEISPAVPASPERSRSVLANPNFLLLWQGQAVSQLGDQAFSLAMALWVAEKTNSARLSGLLLFASTLPAVLLGPVGGVLADRVSRIRILVACDLAGGVAMLAVSLLMLFGGLTVPTIVALLFCAAPLLGVIRGFFQPAVGAVIPDLVPRERLAAANSLSQLSFQASLLLGQGVGGILYRALGAPLLFLVDGVSFLFAAASESLVRLPAERSSREGGRARGFGPFFAELGEGYRFILEKRGFLATVLAATTYNFFIMPIIVLLPFFVRDYLHAGPQWYGFIFAAVSAGAIVGFLLVNLLRLRGAARGRLMTAAFLLAPSPFFIGFVRSPALALAIALFLGVLVGIINVNFMTLAQAATAPEIRGRVFGLISTLAAAAVPLGFVVGGFVGELTGKNVPLVYGSCGVVCLLADLLAILRKSTREFMASE